MAEAQHLQKLKKEQPFVLGIAADRVKPQFPHEEQVLIQGIIDAFFEEGDDLILMDYKTDAVKTGEELVKRYHTQMEILYGSLRTNRWQEGKGTDYLFLCTG